MASESYLISCKCGQETAVRLTAAGTILHCPQCRASMPMPSFRELRQLPIVAELAAPAPPFQFSLMSLFILTLMVGIYFAAANYWGYWRVTIISSAMLMYAAIQGLLLYRGTSLVAYGNAIAFIAIILILPTPNWLLIQREQARLNQSTQKLVIVGQRVSEEVMLHGESRNFAQTFQRLETELFPEGI